jgi:hypothetical protein
MEKLILQLWEQSEQNSGIQPDGCSLHIDDSSLKIFIDEFYSKRNSNDVPDVYERVVGNPVEVFVDDKIFNIVSNLKSVRLQEYEMNNLMNLKEISTEV